MLDNLIDLVKQHADSTIGNNNAIPSSQNHEAIETASHSIVNGLKGAVANGNINEVMSLFSGKQDVAQNPVTRHIEGGFIQNLMSKFGLDHLAASGIATSLIPTVLEKLVHKTNDPNDSSFNLQSILGQVAGNNINAQDVMNNLSSNNAGSAAGGLMDKVKSFFN